MTPQEAVDVLVGATENDKPRLLKLFEKVVATAKSEETRRCAARLRHIQEQSVRAGETNPFRDVLYLDALADDLLRTGGLEVEDLNGKTERRSQ